MKDNEYGLQGSHNHDDRYFTETEITNKLKFKALDTASSNVKVYGNDYFIAVRFTVSSRSFADGGWSQIANLSINPDYAPNWRVQTTIEESRHIQVAVNSSGTLLYLNTKGGAVTTSASAYVVYPRKF